MSEIAIKVENLSKLYQIGVKDRGLLSERISHSLKSLFSKNGRPQDTTDFWALKDINFEVKRGEAVGIIGKNGAGKSTLLKIISRITKPTTGKIRINGRVASLLEVGTGFHPELTGRENIYMNGAILGMKRSEIKQKFDEIVEFSGIEKFIDTPVKHYSSGMLVRLGFAVAAHLEPDILIVDEVLAVGDAEFQKKCLGKMDDVVKSEGRTVLFVSHNMNAMRQFCEKCILIETGKVKCFGETRQVIDHYLSKSIKTKEISFDSKSNADFQVIYACLKSQNGEKTSYFSCFEDIILEIECEYKSNLSGIYGYITISNSEGLVILESDSFDTPPNCFDGVEIGFHRFQIIIPKNTIGVGKYVIYLNFTTWQEISPKIYSPREMLAFEVSDTVSKRGNSRNGFFAPVIRWLKIEK